MKSCASNINTLSRGILRWLTIGAVIVSLGLPNNGAPLRQDPNATLPSKSKPTTNSNSNDATKSGTKKAKRRRRSSAVAAPERQGPIQAEQETAEATAGIASERQRRIQAEKDAAEASAGVARERQRRIQAEQEAAKARAAQVRAEQELRRKKDIWLMITVLNRTNGPIPYQVLCSDLWSSFTLNPGYQITHVCLNDDISLKYDYKYAPGFQERIYHLEATAVVGHTPTDEEKARARVNFFQVDTNGDITLFGSP